MDNITQHISERPLLAALFVVALISLIAAIPYFMKHKKIYGSMFEFSSTFRKASAAISAAVVVGIGIFFSTPYVPPPSSEIAIVLGNTQNSPAPLLSGQITDTLIATMIRHKGMDAKDLAESIKIISAVKQPDVIDLSRSKVKLRSIGHNNSNAKRDAKLNVEAIEAGLNKIAPTDNGANYFEAILEARDNVEPGSKIIVIGSGLSDNGDLNFSKSNILTSETTRNNTIDTIQEKYGGDYLSEYTIEFYGLGDSSDPQMPLSNIQKDIVRDVYEDTVRKLGGKVVISTDTRTGEPVATKFEVGTTDTGCGDLNLVYDDEDLKFVGDHAIFVDATAAKEALSNIRQLWDSQSDTIELIQVDGYTAHYPGADTLSQDRADTVKKTLTDFGIPSERINATGKGYGPYELDSQNRTVKVNITRNNEQCIN